MILFCGGLAIAGHETLLTPDADPQLLILAAGMMGLPGVLRADSGKSPDKEKPPP